MPLNSRAVAALFAALSACSGAVDPASQDAGTRPRIDAGTPDASTPDAGSTSFEGLVINEVAAAGTPADWFELYNGTGQAIELSNFTFTDDATDPTQGHFPAGSTLPAQGYFLQEVSDEATGFKLGSDEALYLFGPAREAVDEVDWREGESPVGTSYGRLPNGSGPFQTLLTPTPGAANRSASDTCGDDVAQGNEACDGADLGGESCETQGFVGGLLNCNATCDAFDPGDCYSATSTTVVLNEARSSGNDEIELFNTRTSTVDLSGWYVTDDGYDPADATTFDHRYDLAAGTQVGPRGFFVLTKGVHHTFGLGGLDAVYLYDATGLVKSQVEWADGEALVSYCRRPDGLGAWSACTNPSFGSTNGATFTGALNNGARDNDQP